MWREKKEKKRIIARHVRPEKEKRENGGKHPDVNASGRGKKGGKGRVEGGRGVLVSLVAYLVE